MTANTPSKPHSEGDKFTNNETGITYEFKSGAWRAVSSEAADAVVDAVAGINLQKVLDNGAVANKGMILRTADPNINGSSEYDAIEIIPAGARVMISAEDGAGWKPTLELVELVPQNAGATRKAQIELDDNRLDINVESVEDEIHFRFADNDYLLLNYTDPSELKGKLKVNPGTQDNEVVTYDQLAAVEATANSSTSNAAFLNKDNGFASNRTNTFYGPLQLKGLTSVGALSSTSSNPNFEIRGTTPTGTVDQPLFFAKNNANKRLEVHYKGSNTSDHSIVTKGYVDDILNAAYGVPYVYRHHYSIGLLRSGDFTVGVDTGNIYIHSHDAKGRRLCSSDPLTFDGDVLVKVYNNDGQVMKQFHSKQVIIGEVATDSSNYQKYKKHQMIYDLDLVNGETYYLSDGFLLPY